jgi:TatD DNase family protein
MQQRPALGSIDELPRPGAGVTLVDSHCHLDFDSFATDVEAVIARAREVGVDKMITIGASGPFAANYEAIDIAARHESVFATVGVHPHEAATVTDELLVEIEALARHPAVVGLGETGLDYHYDNSPRPAQRAAFRAFLALAKRLDLPLSIHLRDADADAATIVAEEGLGSAGGVIHCFSSDARAAARFIDLGLHISFSGILTFKAADALRQAARLVPADRLLLETDSPFLAPVPYRGRRNEPALVVHTAAVLAEVRGESIEAVAATTSENATRLFRLTPRRA